MIRIDRDEALTEHEIGQDVPLRRRPYARRGRPQPYWEHVRRRDLVDTVRDCIASIGFVATSEAWCSTRNGYGTIGVLTGRAPEIEVERGFEAGVIVRHSNDGFWLPAIIATFTCGRDGLTEGMLGPTAVASRSLALDDAIATMVDVLPRMIQIAQRRERAARRPIRHFDSVLLDLTDADVFPRRFLPAVRDALYGIPDKTAWAISTAVHRGNATRSPYDQLETALRLRAYLSDHLHFRSIEENVSARHRRKSSAAAAGS